MRPAFVLTVVVVASLAYLAPFVRSGWIPHDEGLLGLTAERVLAGERPHVDFDDPYTGGQGYLHALAFRIGGTRLSSLRWLLYAFSIPFIVAFWAIARRALSPWWAAAVVATGLVWSLPNYFASLPSWYNLFLAVFGLAALLRWLETRRWEWIAAAGLCGGLSIVVKISGLYFVAAAFVVLLHADDEEGRRTRSGAALVITGAIGAALFPFIVVAKRASIEAFAHFVVPAVLVCVIIACDAWRGGAAPPAVLLRRVALLVAGVAVPVVCFMLPYVSSGDLPALINGVFVAPQQRLANASFDLPPLFTSLAAVPLLFALQPARSRAASIIAGALAIAVIPFGWKAPCYDMVWWAVRSLLLGLTIVAAWLLIRYQAGPSSSLRPPRDSEPLEPSPPRTGEKVAEGRMRGSPGTGEPRVHLVAVLAVVSFCTLIQFPYAFGIYFCYTAPLVLLAAAFLLRYRASIAADDIRFAFAPAALAFVALFAAVWLNTSRITTFGERYERKSETALLLPDRANLYVPAVHAAGYTQLVQIIREHARTPAIYALPDCPEVYFLAEKRSPSRGFYDFLSGSSAAAMIRDVDVVVVNRIPEFSPPVDASVATLLRQRFPEAREIGPFEVRWKREAQ